MDILVTLVIAATFVLSEAKTVKPTDKDEFPPDFIFGAATASYQVEGGWMSNGKGWNIWDTLTHQRPDYIFDKSNGDVACDSYHKYKEDIQLLKQLGVNFYRFSISWARILPKGYANYINKYGIDYYNNLINELLANSINLCSMSFIITIFQVTMYHWDLPEELQDIGGWPNIKLADYFEDYARLLFTHFGDKVVKLWITFNEPASLWAAT
ncbi:hypothetical protein L9F63_027987, partial [Diploptera punctata]